MHFVSSCISVSKQQQSRASPATAPTLTPDRRYSDGVAPTISYAAERLGLRHHTVVELSKRCEEQGLIRRTQNTQDRRYVELQVIAHGRQLLRSLSEDHAHELYELAPRLITALTQIRGFHGKKEVTDEV